MISHRPIARATMLAIACLGVSLSGYAAPSDISVPTMVRIINAPAQATPKAVPADVAGKVVWVKGLFKATTADKKTRTLAKGDLLYQRDTLTTDAAGQAQIVFTDNTLMTFRPSSTLVISSYEYQPKQTSGSAGKYVMDLIEGGFRTITGLIAKTNPSDYKVNTPVATIGVRGTDYAVMLKDGEIFVAYYHGSPCVSSDNKTVCLDKATPYAKAAKDSAPVPMTQRPTELGDTILIEQTTFSGPMGGGGIGGGPPSVNDVLNSFCIQ
jgi:hypothetical protein